ncbi:hypothetical protein [Pseudoalteromonas obscura]|uniref:Uncharacterized protein n=1 Tax=Pseudoalteromonas obscura TaxID=3048491 RepID=A0ABT7EFB1_9GAMM|nr:hypothetical protein [Pseudoalteromonas sp. P94(2023)]MDK2593956.1 hypothetical protein [Pseudoalteromonas sp. P94(2023)]
MSKSTITELTYKNRHCELDSHEINAETFKRLTKTAKSEKDITTMFEAQFKDGEFYSLQMVKSKKHDNSCAILVRGALFSERDKGGKTTTNSLETYSNKNIANYEGTSEYNKTLMGKTLFDDGDFNNIIKNGATIRGKVEHKDYAEALAKDIEVLADEFEVFMKWEFPALEQALLKASVTPVKGDEMNKFLPIYFNDKKIMPSEGDFPLHLAMYKYRTGLASVEAINTVLKSVGFEDADWPTLVSLHPHQKVLKDKAQWLLNNAIRLLIFADKIKHYRQLEKMDTPSLAKKLAACFLKILAGVSAVFGGAAVVATAGISLAGSAAVNAALGYYAEKLLSNNSQTLRNILDTVPSIFAVINNYILARFKEAELTLIADYNSAKALCQAHAVKTKIRAALGESEKKEQSALDKVLAQALSKPDAKEALTNALLATVSDAKTPAKLQFDQENVTL